MKTLVFGGALAALLALAAPVAAQTAPPVPPPPPSPMGGLMPPAAGGWRTDGRMHGGPGMFGSLSEAGRKTMWEAMRAGGDRRAERDQVKAARDRMLVVLEAERLDTAALKQALDDERNAANASRERHQSAMLAAFAKLSVADRKAFVADARAMKARVEERMARWRDRGPSRPDMPPPPQF